LAPIAWIGSDQWRLSMKRLFVQYICISVAAAYLLGIGALGAQVILSQPHSKEVGLALLKEQQASELAGKGRMQRPKRSTSKRWLQLKKSCPVIRFWW
jgi:hypothetical protein